MKNGVRTEDVGKIVEVIKSSKSFLITSHLRPEGDSIGSQLAMKHVLDRLGKQSILVNDDPVPPIFEFLPQSDRIITPEQVNGAPPVSIVLDCGHWDRLGASGEVARRADVVLNGRAIERTEARRQMKEGLHRVALRRAIGIGMKRALPGRRRGRAQ